MSLMAVLSNEGAAVWTTEQIFSVEALGVELLEISTSQHCGGVGEEHITPTAKPGFPRVAAMAVCDFAVSLVSGLSPRHVIGRRETLRLERKPLGAGVIFRSGGQRVDRGQKRHVAEAAPRPVTCV
jgi:hypothetical protein